MSKEKFNKTLGANIATRIVHSAQKFAAQPQAGNPPVVYHKALVRLDVPFERNQFTVHNKVYTVSVLNGPVAEDGKPSKVFFLRAGKDLIETCRTAQDIHYAVMKILSTDGKVYKPLLPGRTELIFLSYACEAAIEMRRIKDDIYACPEGHSWRLKKIDGDKSYWTPIIAKDGGVLMGLPHSFDVRTTEDVLSESKPFNLSMLF